MGEISKIERKGVLYNVKDAVARDLLQRKYTKPIGGIPKEDLSLEVQSLLQAAASQQHYTETDPTVPSWAKQSNKPVYTAAEVGALPITTHIPADPVNADWNASSGLAQILNKPVLFSGSYNDLTDKPSLFSGSYIDLTNKPSLFSGSWNDLTDKPSLFSGSYTDLTDKPTIPTTTSQLTNNSGFVTSSDVSTAIANLVDSAPQTLDTLNELAAALGDDPNFATTISTALGNKVDKVSGKGLSTEDYTTAEKTKLAGIEAGATKTQRTLINMDDSDGLVFTDANGNAMTHTQVKALLDDEATDVIFYKDYYFYIPQYIEDEEYYFQCFEGDGFVFHVLELSWAGNAFSYSTADYDYSVDFSLNSSSYKAIANSAVTAALNSKQNTLTFDNAPTANSNNPVKSGGVYTALSGKANSADLAGVATSGSYDDLDDKPTIPSAVTVDSTITQNGTNPVQGGAIYSALEGKEDKALVVEFTYSNNEYSANKTLEEIGTALSAGFKSVGIYDSCLYELTWYDDSAIFSSCQGNYFDYFIFDHDEITHYEGLLAESKVYTNSSEMNSDEPESGTIGYIPNDGFYLYDVGSQSWKKLALSSDFSNYVPTTRKINNKALSSDITLTASDVGALPDTTVIPTTTSQLTNDSGFLTTHQDITGKQNALTAGDGIAIDSNDTIRTTGIPFGIVDNTSTSTAYTVTVPGIYKLEDGVCCLVKNGKVTSESGFTLNVNGLGAKPSYNNMATGNPITPTSPTRDTTIFNINYTMLFIYSSTLVDGGAWICYRGYDNNTNTIGYQVRSNSHSLPASQKFYRYRLLFTSADGTHYVPANTSSSTNATASRTVNQTPIDPFGHIVYYGTTAAVEANARPSASALWIIYTLSLGYSFNRTGAALTLDDWAPVYLKCAPQANGSAIIDADTPYVQALPTTADGKIYIFLGVAYNATSIELLNSHPVYYHDGTGIRIWTGKTIPTKTSELTNDAGYLTSHQDISGKADVVTVVTNSSTGSVSQALDPNKFYKFTGALTALTLTLNACTGFCIYAGKFTSDSGTACTVTLPNGVVLADNAPSVEAGGTYEFSIAEGLMLLVKEGS